MCTNMAAGSLNLESQLLSIMDVLVKAAVAEISQLFSESSSSLRLHLSQSLRENETLRTRMKVMRSELFSLRLQTRSNRPASRFSSARGNISKARNKCHVVIKPPVAEKAVGDAASVSLQSDKTPPSASEVQCADVESPDVILIKDEDDIGECGPAGDHNDFGSHRSQRGVTTGTQKLDPVSSSCLTSDNEELRIVSVHSGGEGTLQGESNTLFTASELQAFTSLSPDHSIAHDGLLNFPTGDVGLVRHGHAERNHSTHMASPTLSCAIKTMVGSDDRVGHPSHSSQFSQQQNLFPLLVNRSLDCSFCKQSFLTREELIIHRASHTGESPVRCPVCGKSLVNKTTLGIHMRIHTGEKPYACPQCGKRFTQNGSLKIHLRTHSGEKPYTCNQCTASFNNPSNLRRHMITHSADGIL